MQVSFTLQDMGALAALQRMEQQAANLSPVMRDIGRLGVRTTRRAFNNETAPDGTKWKPSYRKLKEGGRTLFKEGHLYRSINSISDANSVSWGAGMLYGVIHQMGGVIKPKTAKKLAFTGSNGHLVFASSVTIPARPFLPETLDQLGPDTIIDIFKAHFDPEK
jgi:phage virion morphogenesis protein